MFAQRMYFSYANGFYIFSLIKNYNQMKIDKRNSTAHKVNVSQEIVI